MVVRGCGVGSVVGIAHISQDLRSATRCLSSLPIIAAIPGSVLACAVCASLCAIRRCWIRHVIAGLGGRRLLVLTRTLRSIVGGGCSLIYWILLGRALIIGIVVGIVAIRGHCGYRLKICGLLPKQLSELR